mgnify:CR=1 FL=1
MQPIVALSSTEAKYKALAILTCEIMWLKKLFNDLDVQVKEFTLFQDNLLTSIHLANNPMVHARSKHIQIHYHFNREKVLTKEMKIKYMIQHKEPTSRYDDKT